MTIKETAGKTLLYFYQLQRTIPSGMKQRQLGFVDKKDGGVSLTTDKKWLTKDLLDINPRAADALNAFMFLLDKGLVQSDERAARGARVYVGVQLTGLAFDLIEGVEYNEEGRHNFGVMFNLAVQSSTDVETLMREHLGELMK